jgi:hypothetical protein
MDGFLVQIAAHVLADPPAPVSNNPPPFIKETIDNILALVPTSRIETVK